MVSLSQGHGCSIIYLSKIRSGSEIFTIQYNHDSFSRESYIHINHKLKSNNHSSNFEQYKHESTSSHPERLHTYTSAGRFFYV